MPSDFEWFEEPGDELDDDEYPDEDDLDDQLTDTVPCPQCGAEVYEDTVACPCCGTYVTVKTGIWSGRPVWWIALGLLGLVAVIVILSSLPPR